MNGESKLARGVSQHVPEAVIDYICHTCASIYHTSNDDVAQGYINEIRATLERLNATAPQPVKFTDCDFGAVLHMSGGSKSYCRGFVDGVQHSIKLIRDAGYQVVEE